MGHALEAAQSWLVLCLVCIAQFMVILDATIVNVALPSIQTDLKLAENDLQWVVNSYTLIFGGFLLLGGRAGDQQDGEQLGGLPGQPSVIQQGEALVTGFHWAYFGGALFFLAGIVVMITMLKRADEAKLDVDRPMTEMVA